MGAEFDLSWCINASTARRGFKCRIFRGGWQHAYVMGYYQIWDISNQNVNISCRYTHKMCFGHAHGHDLMAQPQACPQQIPPPPLRLIRPTVNYRLDLLIRIAQPSVCLHQFLFHLPKLFWRKFIKSEIQTRLVRS